MITPYTVTSGAWTQISSAGQSGTLWLEGPRKNTTSFTGLAIYHTSAGLPDASKINESYWYDPSQQQIPLRIPADDSLDIYYARALDEDVKILVNTGQGIGASNTGIVTDPYLNVGQPFNLKVKQGLIPGHSAIDKFGENPDVDTGTTPEDVWEAGGLYNYDAVGEAPIVSLISDSASDTVPIMVTGLDIDGNEVDQTITLTGTTRVALTTPLWRVYRMQNDDGTDLVGTVYCYVGTGGVPALADIRAIIDNGNNQTLMAIYTVPGKKVGFLFRGEIGASRSQTAGAIQAAYYSRRYEKVFKIKKRVDITNQGSSIYQDERSFPDVIPGLTDIKIRVEEVSANNSGVFATFDILLIDETEFPVSYLEAIGQPGY